MTPTGTDLRGAPLAGAAHLPGVEHEPEPTPRLLVQQEVADLLRVPGRTLKDWRLSRQGPPYLKLGRHVRYDLADVVAWVSGQRHG